MVAIGGLRSVSIGGGASGLTIGPALYMSGGVLGGGGAVKVLDINVDSNFVYMPVSFRIQGGAGFYSENGNITTGAGGFVARNASASISIGSAGSEYFGISAGSNSINITGVLYNPSGTISMYPTGLAVSSVVLGGAFTVNSTAVGNLGASGPDDLQTYTLATNAFTVANRGIKIRAWGTTANNANAKTVRLMFGSTALVTKLLSPSVAGVWQIDATVLRTGASAQKYVTGAFNFGAAAPTLAATDAAGVYSQHTAGTCTETETATITIKTQSTASTADNDIVSQGLVVEYI